MRRKTLASLLAAVSRLVDAWEDSDFDRTARHTRRLAEIWERVQLERAKDRTDAFTDPRKRPRSAIGKVWLALSDGQPHSVRDLAKQVGTTQNSVTALVRDLRKEKYGRWRVVTKLSPRTGRTQSYQNRDPRLGF